jgi:hypothetical protein
MKLSPCTPMTAKHRAKAYSFASGASLSPSPAPPQGETPMMPQTGYTPELTNEAKARNIISRLVTIVGVKAGRGIVAQLLADEGAITPEFVRKLDNLTRQAADKVLELETVHDLIIEAEANDAPKLCPLCRFPLDEFGVCRNQDSAMCTDTQHYPAVAKTVDMPRADDPRTWSQRLQDLDDAETEATRASDDPR